MEVGGKIGPFLFRLFTSVFLICLYVLNAYSQTGSMPNPLLPHDYNSESDPVYTIVEQQPAFNYKDASDSFESYTLYLKDSLRYPSLNRCHGRIFVEFIVEKDGSLSNLRVVKGISDCPDYKEYNKEAMSVFFNMPKWTPGKQIGNPVRVRMILPVDFN